MSDRSIDLPADSPSQPAGLDPEDAIGNDAVDAADADVLACVLDGDEEENEYEDDEAGFEEDEDTAADVATGLAGIQQTEGETITFQQQQQPNKEAEDSEECTYISNNADAAGEEMAQMSKDCVDATHEERGGEGGMDTAQQSKDSPIVEQGNLADNYELSDGDSENSVEDRNGTSTNGAHREVQYDDGDGGDDDDDDDDDGEEEEDHDEEDHDDDDDEDHDTDPDELLGLYEKEWREQYPVNDMVSTLVDSDNRFDDQAAQRLEQEICRLQTTAEKLQEQLVIEQQLHAETKASLQNAENELQQRPLRQEPTPPSIFSSEALRHAVEQLAKAHSTQYTAELDESQLLSIIRKAIDGTHSLQAKTEEQQQQFRAMQQQLQQVQQQQQQQQAASYTPNTPSSYNHENASQQQLWERIQNLEAELQTALLAGSDIQLLKAKALSLLEKVRREKDQRVRAESEITVLQQKITLLSNHIEKLMVHLKHEATAKVKIHSSLRQTERQLEGVRDTNAILVKKCNAKDRLLDELQEGSKILEDQLRLMDEKYLELRTKLDWQREHSRKQVAKHKKVAQSLRSKFALMGGSMLLDEVPVSSMSGEQYAFPSPYQQEDYQPRRRASSRGSTMSQIKPRSNSATARDLMNIVERVKRKGGKSDEWTEEKARNLAYGQRASPSPLSG